MYVYTCAEFLIENCSFNLIKVFLLSGKTYVANLLFQWYVFPLEWSVQLLSNDFSADSIVANRWLLEQRVTTRIREACLADQVRHSDPRG